MWFYHGACKRKMWLENEHAAGSYIPGKLCNLRPLSYYHCKTVFLVMQCYKGSIERLCLTKFVGSDRDEADTYP